jgi:hypothetical protein
MSPVAIGLLAFGLALAGIILGSAVQRTMPKGQFSSDSKEVVKLSLGVLATLAALVLGLLIASAKTTYSAREGEINQITAYVILLDNLLAQYGEGAQAARASLRQAISPMVNQIWREARSVELRPAPFRATAEGEAFYQQLQELQPGNDVQRGLKPRITEVALGGSTTPLVFASWQFDTLPLFGSAAALDYHLVCWFFAHGTPKPGYLGVARGLCTVSLCCNFPYSGT